MISHIHLLKDFFGGNTGNIMLANKIKCDRKGKSLCLLFKMSVTGPELGFDVCHTLIWF